MSFQGISEPLGIDGAVREPIVAPLADREEDAASRMLARAFRDNPLNRAVVRGGPARRVRSNYHGIRAGLRAARPRARRLALYEGNETTSSGDSTRLIAVLVGFDAGSHPAAPPPISTQLRCWLGQGTRVMRGWAHVHRTLALEPVDEPHCYLGLLGVRVERQALGFGRRLLDVWLEQVDAQGMPSYLETDRESSCGFYSAAGYEVVRRSEILNVPIWWMRRPAVRRGRRTHDREAQGADLRRRGGR